MLRMSADGKEGVAFGLYTTTGRAVSFLAPSLFATFIDRVRHRPCRHGRAVWWYWQPGCRRCWRCGCRAAGGALAGRGADGQARAGAAARTATPSMVIEQVTSRPTLMMLTLAESLAGWAARLPCSTAASR